MAESDDNLVLRDIRAELGAVRCAQDAQGERLTRMDRTLDDLRETAITAMGYAAHASLVTKKAGKRFDDLANEIAALKQRVTALEARS